MLNELTQNTAILIFANSAAKDRHDKHIVAEVGVFDVLTQQTLRTVQAVGLPYFHFTEKDQIGETFGERFVNAIASVYEKGFENVITLGNDCPQLKLRHLKAAYRDLQQGNAVLGPAMDGGFYLMGIHKADFDKQTFMALPWQQAQLFGHTKMLFEINGVSLFTLPVLHDLDSQSDVVLLASFVNSVSGTLLAIFRKLIQTFQPIPTTIEWHFQDKLITNHHNKGSPALLFI